MKIGVFLHGTIIMHKSAVGKTRAERVRQSSEREESVLDYGSYVPVGHAVTKLNRWKEQGSEIVYVSSHEREKDVEKDTAVLKMFHFPGGRVFFRRNSQTYKGIIERIVSDVLIEDDCESIGGEKEMAIAFVKPEIKQKVTSIIVKEFEGVDQLPDDIHLLRTWKA